MANPPHSSHASFTCPICSLVCKSGGGLTRHTQAIHRDFTPVSDDDDNENRFTLDLHPLLNGTNQISILYYLAKHCLTSYCIGTPCNERGEYLPPFTQPPPSTGAAANPDDANVWHPFHSRVDFDFAHEHFVTVQSSAGQIDRAIDLWAASIMEYGANTPWKDSAQLYATIDTIQNGDAPWKVYHIHYKGPRPPGTPPKWMTQAYELCTRDSRQVLHHQLSSTQFKDNFNIAPYQQTNSNGTSDGKVRFSSVRQHILPNLELNYRFSSGKGLNHEPEPRFRFSSVRT
jgi:hypothetical protein